MEDSAIIKLYFDRCEQAIKETDSKYGGFCRHIALNILGVTEDAEECVNDTYLAAWDNIPPSNPNSLKAFLGRITRNLSVSRYRSNRAQKRFAGLEAVLDELSECIPSAESTEKTIDTVELSRFLNRWLDSLNEDDCALFVRRYWFGESVNSLSLACGCTPNNTAQKLSRLRKKLKALLIKEGITL